VVEATYCGVARKVIDAAMAVPSSVLTMTIQNRRRSIEKMLRNSMF